MRQSGFEPPPFGFRRPTTSVAVRLVDHERKQPARTTRRSRYGSESVATRKPTRVDKPWGHELWWAETDHYAGKILVVNAGQALSLQYHREKDETS